MPEIKKNNNNFFFTIRSKICNAEGEKKVEIISEHSF